MRKMQSAGRAARLLFVNRERWRRWTGVAAGTARETAILNPLAAAQPVHAVLLSGGSSFGLDAAGGVMQYLEEKDIGLDTGFAKVPLVCAAGIFDLVVGMPSTRPGGSWPIRPVSMPKKRTG